VTTRFAFLLVVTFVSACGAGARLPAAPSESLFDSSSARAIADQNPEDDYVVGPFETPSAGVRTYYIVRN
jgi:hypothetical protein